MNDDIADEKILKIEEEKINDDIAGPPLRWKNTLASQRELSQQWQVQVVKFRFC